MRRYVVEAQSETKERFRIETDSRDRALHFAGIFRANQEYSWVSVAVDGKIWLGEAIGRMP